jgi:hypothetical protein
MYASLNLLTLLLLTDLQVKVAVLQLPVSYLLPTVKAR